VSFPFCILGTAAALWCAKVFINPDLAINNMTLFAIIVVVGEVADGAIIVGESIYRHRELGKSPIQAGKDGVREVGPALSSAYLTTIAGFAPLFLVRGIMGDFLELLPIVTILALIAAIAVAYFLLPVMSVYLMKPKSLVTIVPRHPDGRPMTDEEQEIAGVDALVAASPMKQMYGRILGYALHHRLLVLTLSVVLTLVPVGLFTSGAVGFELFPESDVPIVEVYFELPLGASMQNKTVAVAQQIEETVLKAVRPEEWYKPTENGERVRPVTTIGEPGALNIRLDAPMSTGPEFGMVYVELELAENRSRSAAEIRHAIAQALPPMPGVIVRITSPEEGPPAGAPVLLRVLAHDQTSLETMAQHAARVQQLLASTPGVFDITNDYRNRPQLVVTPNREMAALFNVDAAQIATSVNYALEGVLVGDVDFGGDDDIDLRLRNRASDRDQLSDLSDLMLVGSTGRRVTLEQVASIERGMATHVIERYDRRRVINIRSNIEAGVLPDDVKAAMVAALRPELSPLQQHAVVMARDTMVIAADDEVTVEFGGENEIRDKAVEDLQLAMAISMGLMLIILVVQFNSFVQPMIILFSVPLCLVGVAIGLMLWGLNFSVMSMIGIVALSGIVVDNAMVLVEFINKMRDLGVPLEKAVVYAGQLRVRPLILTTLTNVVGMVPVSMNWSGGGEIWQPLAVTIMAGLAFATVVQLVIVPLAVFNFNRDNKPGLLDPTLRPEYSGKVLPAQA
jgi:HAE1 family hydrophobic/amphiphilic exporter-1